MRFALMLIASLVLSACETLPVPSQTPKAPSQKIDRLQPINLSPGACGFFIWTADSARRFILFSSGGKDDGRWFHDGREQGLTIISQFGEVDGGELPRIEYQTEDGKALKLALEKREYIDGGTRFKAGTLSYKDDEGWDRVEPVVGLATCQPS
ncbi:MAG: hypothetical protein ACSHXY_12795 [Alphaproteobacteria bacterium]